MPKLSDTQLVILASAAKRDNGSILPLPKRLKLDEAKVTQVLGTLVNKKLAAERPANRGAAVWRHGVDGERTMLTVTKTGLQAIGIEPGSNDQPAGATNKKKKQRASAKITTQTPPDKRRLPRKKPGKTARPPTDIRPDTKQAKIIGLLRRSRGASIEQIMAVTGWQAHSVRGVLSGTLKKKLGLTIVSDSSEHWGRIYRIADHG